MSFKVEEDMYDLIKSYLEKLGYAVIIDKPRGSGVKFRSLKGWTIDVVGVKKERPREVIAIEAKNNLGSSSVLDALSKAEMYRNVCTRVYVAFPRKKMGLKENRPAVREIRQECERRGIGILEVGDECQELIQAVPTPLRVDMLREILNEFERRTSRFQGFEEEDFARYFSDEEEDVVWHKFRIFAEEVEKRIRKNGFVLTRKATRDKWWYSFSRKALKTRRYFDVPHFTLSFWGDGIVLELIAREGSFLNNLRRKVKSNRRAFYKIISNLRKASLPYELKMIQRVHVKGYETETGSEYIVHSPHLTRENIKELTRFLLEKREKGKIWLWVGHMFHLKDDETHTEELIDLVEEAVNELDELYKFIIL